MHTLRKIARCVQVDTCLRISIYFQSPKGQLVKEESGKVALQALETMRLQHPVKNDHLVPTFPLRPRLVKLNILLSAAALFLFAFFTFVYSILFQFPKLPSNDSVVEIKTIKRSKVHFNWLIFVFNFGAGCDGSGRAVSDGRWVWRWRRTTNHKAGEHTVRCRE